MSHLLVFKMICKYGLSMLHSHYRCLDLLPQPVYCGYSILSFIFIGAHRHDIISNEIRTNLTINFLMNNLMYLMLAVPGVNVIHMITLVTGAPSLVLVSAF